MRAAILGAGVIGQGWAVRFALFGWNVAIYDQNPNAVVQCRSLLERVQAKVQTVYETLPTPGTVEQYQVLEEALAGAQWVQESLPEDLSLKQQLYAEVIPLMGGGGIICSSTSGFTPSSLFQQTAQSAVQGFVCHPFNPVYLLPLAEIVAHPEATADAVEHVTETLTSIGMFPMLIEKEIDAHVADRLLEAVWREALWMVKDGVATTGQIDRAITHGFGLRWAQMGLFETYRLGGGAGGMARFLAQFGPTLQLPWSRLTDVPELDEELIQQIVSQTERQSDGVSVDSLAAARDENLVALLQALKQRDWGAGAHINRYVGGVER